MNQQKDLIKQANYKKNLSTYRFTVKCKEGSRTFVQRNYALRYALQNFLKDCIDKGERGIFFKLTDVDFEHVKSYPGFQVINQKYGIIIEDVQIIEGKKVSYYARRIKEIREMCGLSMDEAAKLVQVSEGCFKRIENDAKNTNPTTQRLIANFLISYINGTSI